MTDDLENEIRGQQLTSRVKIIAVALGTVVSENGNGSTITYTFEKDSLRIVHKEQRKDGGLRMATTVHNAGILVLEDTIHSVTYYPGKWEEELTEPCRRASDKVYTAQHSGL